MEGSIADIEDTQDQMWEDLSEGIIILNFNGFTITADPFLLIDGEVYDPLIDEESSYYDSSSYEEEESSYDYVTPEVPNVINCSLRRCPSFRLTLHLACLTLSLHP